MGWTNADIPFNKLKNLPPKIDLENVKILKKAIQANKHLAELKGYCQTLPNPDLLLNTVILQESKDSSAIENIVTTQDDLYRALLSPFDHIPPTAKEVIRYREAMYTGMNELHKRQLFTGKIAIKIMQQIKDSGEEFRTMPGTKLSNPNTNRVIYTPPDPGQIAGLMAQWEKFVNTENDIDPLIIMALMHYQFEAIHPFHDGNGRTGRILNVLYLVHKGLLIQPLLYHSAYIIQHKTEYYKKLRCVTEKEEWVEWIEFMLDAIKETAITTLNTIKSIIHLKETNLELIRGVSQKLPAYELNDLIFSFPYVKIKTLVDKKIAKRQAASQYLQKLAAQKILTTFKYGKEIYYVNQKLMDILVGR